MAWTPHIDSSFQVWIIAVCVALLPVAPILVGLRLWSKRIIRSRLLWADLLVCLSCITLLGVWIPIIVLFARGDGATWPLEERPIGFWIMRVECLVVASTFYLLSSYLCRISILCIYYELLRQLPKMRHFIVSVGVLVAICGLVSLGVQLGVGIQDVLFVQADLGPDAKKEGVKWIVYGVLPDAASCVCDLVVFAMPLRSLWKLQLRSPKRKIRLISTFAVGFLACILSLARILIWKVPGYVGASFEDPYIRLDAFEISYPVEITVGILGACLPLLRPILHRKEYASRFSSSSFALGPVQDSSSQTALNARTGSGGARESLSEG